MAYLLQTSSLSLAEIFQKLRCTRPLVRPNRGFVKQLMELEINLRSIPNSTLQLTKNRAIKSLAIDFIDINIFPEAMADAKLQIRNIFRRDGVDLMCFMDISSCKIQGVLRYEPNRYPIYTIIGMISSIDLVESCTLVKE